MEPPRTKRQKVNIACDQCRARKIKCDGRQPVCEPCGRKTTGRTRCTWQSGSDRLSSQLSRTTDHLPSLRQHSQDAASFSSIEQHQLGAPQTSNGNRASQLDNAHLTSQSPDLSHSSASPSNTRSSEAQHNAHRPDEAGSSGPSVHAIIGATLDEDNTEGYFGTSSAGTFMQSVKKLVQQKVHGVPPLPVSSPLAHGRTPPASGHYITQPKPVEYVLPSRRRADILMSCYWRYVHVLYPYLDKMHMEQDYEKLWKTDGSITDERSFMCLINVIFALSSQIDDLTPIRDRQGAAQVFYLRAKELLDIVETGSVRSVQCLLLLGQYYQSTSEPHPCWIFTGLAVRTAQSLGLHFTETSESAVDVRTRELLRKVWHGCILMDRVVSMTYGRPCMIGPKASLAVPLPLPIDEEYLAPDASQPQPVKRPRTFSVEFYVLSLKLYDIMHDVIFSFYSVNGQVCQPADGKDLTFLDQGQNSVFEIERRLSSWVDSIPDHFRLTSVDTPRAGTLEATLHRQAVILHQR